MSRVVKSMVSIFRINRARVLPRNKDDTDLQKPNIS